MKRGALVFAVAFLAAIPSPSTGQIAVRGGVQIARAQHRVVDAGMLVASSGTLFGGTLVLTIGRRYEIQGEALGGRLTAGSAQLTKAPATVVFVRRAERKWSWAPLSFGSLAQQAVPPSPRPTNPRDPRKSKSEGFLKRL